MINLVKLEYKGKTLEIKKLENIKNTRFTQYFVFEDNNKVMTSFHYKACSDYFSMIAKEILL